ncbi:MAG: folate-binding protein YgfZ [Acidimicrobiaceae bacterium]|nr:folate-binding protein YgfZ [Acidimicrobiaceae bacterium]
MTTTGSDPDTGLLAWATIEARGEDAASFLQGQLSQDLAGITDGGTWALLLAPDSVVVSTCFVTMVPEGYDLVVPAAQANDALARLKRFLLRTKCTLEVISPSAGPFVSIKEQIDARWPGVQELQAHLTPHSFGRGFVKSTISFDKGCFTGQELVGRLDARGSSVPWRMVHVEGPSAQVLDSLLKSKGPDGPQGVTSWYPSGERVVGLGFAHRTLVGALEESPIADVIVEEVD